jgi:hypothetical protein
VRLQDSGLPDRVIKLLADADYTNVGSVMEQLAIDEDRVLGIEGFGPKLLDELKQSLPPLTFPEAEAAPEPAVDVAPTASVVEAAPATPAAEAPAPAEAVPTAPADPKPTKIKIGAGVGVVVEEESETEQSFEELIGEEGESDDDKKDKSGKKGKKKGKAGAREIVFDEDLGMFISKKKRKAGRGGNDWEGVEE